MTDALFLLTRVLFFGMLVSLIGSSIVAAVFLVRSRRPDCIALSFEPPVSVIIPAYNEAGRIGRCLEALLAEGYPAEKLEIMVVDDGSTDATAEAVSSHPRVRFLRRDHGGKVKALNAGVASARHELVVCIDADTRLRPGSIAALVRPLDDSRVGAVTGVAKVANPHHLLGWFQSVEYLANAFLRECFASIFHFSPGICGALTAYRRSALLSIGGFKPDTAAEDFDVAMELAKRGISVFSTREAIGYTEVPETFRSLLRQRVRWMKGCMQCFVKHRGLLLGNSPALAYLVATQVFWIVYALLSLPLIAYSFGYWLPLFVGSPIDLGFYVLRWMSLVGPVYMLLKIPEWGINNVYFFGVLAGLLSPALMLVGILRHERLTPRSALAICFYFPYTLVLSAMMVGSLTAYIRSGGKGAFVN